MEERLTPQRADAMLEMVKTLVSFRREEEASKRRSSLALWDRAVAAWRVDPYRFGKWVAHRHGVAVSAGSEAALAIEKAFGAQSPCITSPAGVASGL